MAEDVRLTLGTKEHLILNVSDRMKNITTLDGTNAQFDVRLKDDPPLSTWIVQNVAVTNIGMTAYCLVDTTGWVEGRYELYIHFSALPEAPRLGPFDFRVDS